MSSINQLEQDMNFPEDENGKLLAEMVEAGVDLTQATNVDFFHLFEQRSQAQQMVELLSQQHPETQVELNADNTPGIWEVSCTINILPSYVNICHYEKHYEAIAEQCHGYADGWGILAEE